MNHGANTAWSNRFPIDAWTSPPSSLSLSTLQAATFLPAPPGSLTRMQRALSAGRGVCSFEGASQGAAITPRGGDSTSCDGQRFPDGLKAMGQFGRWSKISVSSRQGGGKGQCSKGKKEELSSSDALDAYIVPTYRRRGGGRRQFPFGDRVTAPNRIGRR